MTLARLPLGLLACVLFALSACDEDNCSAGELCDCTGGAECYLSCDEPGCDQSCHNTNDCGGVCTDDCSFQCHDVRACSNSCGNNCHASCHNVTSCEAILGANSTYNCAEAETCGAEVGNGSNVICSNLTSCVVLCHGTCNVECDEVGGPCQVYCGTRESQPRTCASGTSCGCN